MAATMKRIVWHFFLLFLAIYLSYGEKTFSARLQNTNDALKESKNPSFGAASNGIKTKSVMNSRLVFFPGSQKRKNTLTNPEMSKLDKLDEHSQSNDRTVEMSLNNEFGNSRNYPNLVPSDNTNVAKIFDHYSADDRLSKFIFTKMNKMTQRTMKAAKIATKNLNEHSTRRPSPRPTQRGREGNLINPGDVAAPFTLQTLNGNLVYPGPVINATTAVLLHAFTRDCGFIDALWHSEESLGSILINSPETVHYIFLSSSTSSSDAAADIDFMQKQLQGAASKLKSSQAKSALNRMHFVPTPLGKLKSWFFMVFADWRCWDHNCGIDQINVTSKDTGPEGFTLPRLDGHYDWLPSPVFGNHTMKLINVGNGCDKVNNVTSNIALVMNGSCSYFQKMNSMQESGAKGVLIMADNNGTAVEDMQCHGSDCEVALHIPGAMIPYNFTLLKTAAPTVMYQSTPWINFFIGIDRSGRLAEVGWFLYPSFQFLVWQAQWFDYLYRLDTELSKPSMIIQVLDHVTMKGKQGVMASVEVPPMKELQRYGRVELDMSLSCPGKNDEACPHWDHTVQLYVCCNTTSPLCGMELGRWISPFRRRIGEWLTDITPLIPLLSGDKCNLTMKTVPWALAWMPSLNLRLTQPDHRGPAATEVIPLFTVGATFDKNYNSHWKPVTVAVPKDAKKVVLVAVITGHGSDNNGCGEFCVTSHHFTINNHTQSVTFKDAGTPLGCADQVPSGVEPNEHGTWLYGRDGWCDGKEVDPITFDWTALAPPGGKIEITYRGTFNGTDPDPVHSPGFIILYSYLSIYQDL